MEEAMPLKSFFGSFQYLDSLPSYKDSTFFTNARYCEWIRDLHSFLETRSTFFQESL